MATAVPTIVDPYGKEVKLSEASEATGVSKELTDGFKALSDASLNLEKLFKSTTLGKTLDELSGASDKSKKSFGEHVIAILAGKESLGSLTSASTLASLELGMLVAPITAVIAVLTLLWKVVNTIESETFPTFRTLLERSAQANAEISKSTMAKMGVDMVDIGSKYKMGSDEAMELMKNAIAAKIPGVMESISGNMGGFINTLGTQARGLGIIFEEEGSWIKRGGEKFRTFPEDAAKSLYMVKGASDELHVSHLNYKNWVERVVDTQRPLVGGFDEVTKMLAPYARQIQAGTMSIETATKRLLGLGELGPKELMTILGPVAQQLPDELRKAVEAGNPMVVFELFHKNAKDMPKVIEMVREAWMTQVHKDFPEMGRVATEAFLKTVPQLSALISGSYAEIGHGIKKDMTGVTIDFNKAIVDATDKAKDLVKIWKEYALTEEEKFDVGKRKAMYELFLFKYGEELVAKPVLDVMAERAKSKYTGIEKLPTIVIDIQQDGKPKSKVYWDIHENKWHTEFIKSKTQ